MSEAHNKIEVVLTFARAGEFFLMLDARQPGVSVPSKLAEDPRLVLKFSYRYGSNDLEITEWGVKQTLSFGGPQYRCAIPWSAIYIAGSRVLGHDVGWAMPEEPPPATRVPFKGLRLVN